MSEENRPAKEQKSIIPIGSRGIELATFDELFRFSDFIVKAGLAPRSIDTPEKVFLTLQYSMEMGFSPMIGLQNAMIINNRVSYYGEFVVGLVQNHPDFEDMKTEYFGEGQDLTCKVTLTRKGITPSVGTFSIRQAQHLINDPAKASTWGKYPKRMLFWRAFSMAKTIFSDALKGISLPTDFDEADLAKPAKVTEVVTITKPTFNETHSSRAEVAGDTDNRQSDEGGSGNQQPTAAAPETQDARPDHQNKVISRSSEPVDVPGHREADAVGGPPKPKDTGKAKKLLALINKHNLSQADVIAFLESFGFTLGGADKSGLVDDLPEETALIAIQQFETIRFDLTKKVQQG